MRQTQQENITKKKLNKCNSNNSQEQKLNSQQQHGSDRKTLTRTI